MNTVSHFTYNYTFALNFTLPDSHQATPAFFCFIFAWNVSFYAFTLTFLCPYILGVFLEMSFSGNLFIFRERGRREKERERNIDVREKHWLIASPTHPYWGPNPQPRCVPWQGMEPVTFCFMAWCSTNWDTLVRAYVSFFKI